LIRPHPHLLCPSVEVRMTESEVPLVVLLIALGAVLGWRVARRATPALDHARPRPSPRPLKPRTPQDCPDCRISPPEGLPSRSLPKPYPHVKSPRGCKKRLITAGYACPNPNCLYVGITDDRIHALVGCGHHGCHDRIQDLRCQACRRKFSVRLDPALYRLKTPAKRVADVLGPWPKASASGLPPASSATVSSPCAPGSLGPACRPPRSTNASCAT
jgi:hypothetical protein